MMNNREPVQEQNGAEEDIEIFMLPGSVKPLVMAQPSVIKSRAKRRWLLLKNVARATRRRSSLTEDEEKMLKVLSINQSYGSDENSTVQRDQLRASIASRRSTLSSAESKFLHSLAGCELISPQELEKSVQVLNKDPLYQENTYSLVANEDPSRIEKQDRSKLTRGDASFRKETWEQYVSTSFQVSTRKPEVEEIQKPVSKLGFISSLLTQELPETPMTEPEVEEDRIPYSILATSAHDENCQPHVLSPPIMDALRQYLPFVIQEDNFWLKYSMIRDGASMRSLLHHARSSSRTILAIETMDGDVFGSFTSSHWRPNGSGYYGSGEAFVWRLRQSRFTNCDTVEEQIKLESDIEVFSWAGQNHNVQSLVNPDSQLVVGGGGPDSEEPMELPQDCGAALILDSNLTRGTSQKCLTFDNPILPTNNQAVFDIANIEVWTVTPVEDLDQAERLELGRQFVFDHGNFAGCKQ